MTMIDPARLARAVHLNCQRTSPATYVVTGGTADHVVEVVDGAVRCDCFDAQFRGDACKHSLIVRLYAGDPDVVSALRQLIAPPRRLRRVA